MKKPVFVVEQNISPVLREEWTTVDIHYGKRLRHAQLVAMWVLNKLGARLRSKWQEQALSYNRLAFDNDIVGYVVDAVVNFENATGKKPQLVVMGNENYNELTKWAKVNLRYPTGGIVSFELGRGGGRGFYICQVRVEVSPLISGIVVI